MNRERKKALGKVFFDVAKYLLTTTAVGSFVVKGVNIIASVISCFSLFGLIAIAYYNTSGQEESTTTPRRGGLNCDPKRAFDKRLFTAETPKSKIHSSTVGVIPQSDALFYSC